MKKLIILLAIFFSLMINANAASSCSYKEQVELNRKAANIKRDYELAKYTEQFSDGPLDVDVFRITVLNITEEFYIEVTNNVNDEVLRFNYSDTDNGTVTFDWKDLSTMATFSIKIYTSSETGCPDEARKTLILTTPRFNEYSNTLSCHEMPEFNLCQKYVTFKDITLDEFNKRINAYKEGKVDENEQNVEEDNFWDKLLDFWNVFKWVLLVIILVGISYGGYRTYRKIKRQKEIGL